MLIPIAPGVEFDPRELQESFVRASGPGGQNVNKVSSAVQMRLDLQRPGSLPEELKIRLAALAGRAVSADGVLMVQSQRHRSQDRNRQDALERLVALLRAAAIRPVKRRKTRPTLASVRRQKEAKQHRSGVKQHRGAPKPE